MDWVNKLCHALGSSALATRPIHYHSTDSIGTSSSQKKKVNYNCTLVTIVLHVMFATSSVTVYTRSLHLWVIILDIIELSKGQYSNFKML